MARYRQPILDDLRGGLFIYEKIYRQLLCTWNSAKYVDTAQFDDNLIQATDAAEFEAVKNTENQQISKYSFVEPEIEDNQYDDKETAGYQPLEFLRGYSQSTDGSNKAYAYDDRVSVSRPGIFGHCQDSYPAKFMENLESEPCVPQQAT